MKKLFLLLSIALLNGCGGGGGSASVDSITASNLYYGLKAQIQISGTNLVTLQQIQVTPKISNCSNVTPISVSGTGSEQTFSCTVTAIGDMVVQALDVNGNVLLSKTVNVPAPLMLMTTTNGTILVQLDPSAAPLAVKNFLNYADSGFYAGSIFHRVIAGFVAQGGGFKAGLIALTQTLPNIALESNNGLHNLRGTIAMARTAAADSANSQFYFNLVDNPSLDYKDANNPGYAVFGKITQGLNVMDAIGAVPTATFNGVTDVPVSDIVISSVRRLQ